jgi:hypothetical protein
MITIKLGDKTYEVPFFSGVAMRKTGDVYAVFEKAKAEEPLTDDDLDTVCEWFVALFRNQFSVQEFLEGYPVDDLLQDIFAAYIAVEKRSTKVFKEFPLPPITIPKPATKKTATV